MAFIFRILYIDARIFIFRFRGMILGGDAVEVEMGPRLSRGLTHVARPPSPQQAIGEICGNVATGETYFLGGCIALILLTTETLARSLDGSSSPKQRSLDGSSTTEATISRCRVLRPSNTSVLVRVLRPLNTGSRSPQKNFV